MAQTIQRKTAPRNASAPMSTSERFLATFLQLPYSLRVAALRGTV